MDLVLAAIAVAAFAATVFVLARAGERVREAPVRTVTDPVGEEWLTVREVAELLDVRPSEVTALAERDAIPHFVLPGGSRSDPAALRFRRDEIDAWTIG